MSHAPWVNPENWVKPWSYLVSSLVRTLKMHTTAAVRARFSVQLHSCIAGLIITLVSILRWLLLITKLQGIFRLSFHSRCRNFLLWLLTWCSQPNFFSDFQRMNCDFIVYLWQQKLFKSTLFSSLSILLDPRKIIILQRRTNFADFWKSLR